MYEYATLIFIKVGSWKDKEYFLHSNYKMPSLTGKNDSSSIHLSGKTCSLNSRNELSLEIKRLKAAIISQILLPLLSNQWETLYQNIFLIEILKKKIQSYHSYSQWREELSVYDEMLQLLEKVINEHRQLEEIEKKMYGTGVAGEEIMSFIYKTTAIRLKPEYEIYDTLFGKPQRDKNEKYREDILQDIQSMLSMENIHFSKIQSVILKKYGTIIY